MGKIVQSLRPAVVQQAIDELNRQQAVDEAIEASNRAGRKIGSKEAKAIK
jgi:hypothetical protein